MARAIKAERAQKKPVADSCAELNPLQEWLGNMEPWLAGSIIATLMGIIVVCILLAVQAL